MAFLGPFFDLLNAILEVVKWIVIVWVILSWLLFFASHSSFRWRNRGAYHLLEQLNDIFARMTYPFLRPFRRFLRRWDTAGIDWSPMLLFLVIWLVEQLITNIWSRLILRL